MASGHENNSLKLDGKDLSNFAEHLNEFDVSAAFCDAMVHFVKSLIDEVGLPPMKMNELEPIVEECFSDVFFKEFMKRGVKKVLNRVASRLRSSPVFVSRFDGRDIEMLLSDEAGFETAFTEALKSVPRVNSIYELEVSKDCLRNVIYAVAPAHALPETGVAPQMEDIMRKLVTKVHGDYEMKKWKVIDFRKKIKRNLASIASDLKKQPITLTSQ